MDKVYGGTSKGTESLCMTCRHAFIAKSGVQELVICRVLERGLRIRFPISECRTYDDKRIPSISDMKLIAWEVHSRKRGPIGFAGDSDDLITIEPPSRYGVQYGEPATESGEVVDG